MKKILIGVIIALLIGFGCLLLIKGINIGNLRLESISDLKAKSSSLESTLSNANNLTKKEYPSQIEALNTAIKNLNLAKEQYQNKTANMENPESIGINQVKTYKVEYLWTIIGNYATKQGVTLSLDIKNAQQKDVYDLDFNLKGSYTSITQFIYNIQDDENLKFEIENLQIITTEAATKTENNTNVGNNNTNTTNTANTTNTTNKNTNTNKENTKTTTETDGKTLQATFTVKNIGIELN